MHKMKKTVGIILREFLSYSESLLYGFKSELIPFLRKYNVNVIAIPIMFENEDEFHNIKEILDLCDGIIFPGGAEIFDLDSKIVKYLYEIDKPTLGICLGMQIMAKSFSQKDRKEIQGEKHKSDDEYVHNIRIIEDSLLYKIIGKKYIKVNSRHTKKIIDTKLKGVAYSDDNTLEAIEDNSKKFFIGVQWHPESLIEDTYSNRLFSYFMSKL